MESRLDLNLLSALNALLEERSVTGAAARLHTSAPAMSRTLARLRRALGDPVLVRAGRGMVPTPRAMAMHTQVRSLVIQAQALLVPGEQPDPAQLSRSFALQANDLLLSTVGSALMAGIRRSAPGVSLRFVPESHEDTHALRDGTVDLELGHVNPVEPEVHVEPLLSARMRGVARADHPIFDAPITLREFAAAEHLVTSRRGRMRGPIDDLLVHYGLRRRVVCSTPTFAGAMFLLRTSDLLGLIPDKLTADWVETFGLRTFDVPLALPSLEIDMAWHPRHDADGAHQWLREQVRSIVHNG